MHLLIYDFSLQQKKIKRNICRRFRKINNIYSIYQIFIENIFKTFIILSLFHQLHYFKANSQSYNY